MSRKNATPTEKKLRQIIDDIENMPVEAQKRFDAKLPFDNPCFNDFCQEYLDTGIRAIGTAWKKGSGNFGVFCVCCGQEFDLSKKDFKGLNQSIKNPGSRGPKEIKKEVSYVDLTLYGVDFDDYDMVERSEVA